MRRVKIVNPTINATFKGYLSADYTAGGTTLSVDSNVSFSPNDIIIVGEPSEEICESKEVSSLTGKTSLNLASGLNFNHEKGTAIYKVPWDQISIESQPANGSFSVISTSPIQWDSKTFETYYFDQSGDSTFSYRFRFYNSVLNTYSEYSPTITGGLPPRNSVGYMIKNIRDIIDDRERKVISDAEIIRQLNRAQDIIYAHNPTYWFLKVDTWAQTLGTGPNIVTDLGIPIQVGVTVYSLAQFTDMAHMDKLKYRYNPTDDPTVTTGTNVVYLLRREIDPQFDRMVRDLNRGKLDILQIWRLLPGDDNSPTGYIELNPVPRTTGVGLLYPIYFKKLPDLATNADTTIIPYPAMLEDYVISFGFALKGNEQKAQEYKAFFYGPADKDGADQELTGLRLLDMWDRAKKYPSGQPKYISRYLGQKPERNLWGEFTIMSPDYRREAYF